MYYILQGSLPEWQTQLSGKIQKWKTKCIKLCLQPPGLRYTSYINVDNAYMNVAYYVY
jgi:hypothetical protein